MRRVLLVIVVAEFLCTSVWFAGNAISNDIVTEFHLAPTILGHLTSVVQLGFILGTLTFAIFAIADRFSPSVVFFFSAILAALFNLGMCLSGIQLGGLLVFRFLTGFFLAGIYPVGMKIASDHFQRELGKSLGFLVGALVLGTALPHLLKDLTIHFPWRYVIFSTSGLSVIGGIAMISFVPNGQYRKRSPRTSLIAFMQGFKRSNFRSAAFGYFGHMWELYAFWAFVPIMIGTYQVSHPDVTLNVSLLTFLIIASGSVACVISGLLGQAFGAKKIATLSLFLSFLCCLVSPLILMGHSAVAFIVFLFLWGLVVIADSPLFSTLVAQSAKEETRGASLTIVNCIGFSITIISIQLLNYLSTLIASQYLYLVLGIGPFIGLYALIKKNRDESFAQGK